jgi:dipeptidyl aminopeptidase/acylaminoacyl peptidase
MLKSACFLFLALFCVLPAFAEYPKPPLEAYGALPSVSNAEVSLDGSKIAMIFNRQEGTYLLVTDANTGELIKGVSIGAIKARSVAFYDNTHVILRASDTIKTHGFRGEYEYGGAFAINIETGKVEQLLYRTKGLFPAQSGIGRIVGRGSRADEVLMPAYYGEASDSPSLHLYRAKLGERSGRTLIKGTPDTRDWFVGENGKVLARVRYQDKSNMLRVQYRSSKKWKTAFEEKREIPFALYGVMPDESGLVFSLVQADEAGFTGLMKLGFDGTIEGPLIPIRDREIEQVLTDENRKVVGVQYAGVVPEYAFLDADLQSSYEATHEAFPNSTLKIDSWSKDRSVVLFQVFDASLGDVWLVYFGASKTFRIVSNKRPDIPTNAMAVMMDIKYQARDDLQIQAILSAPPNFDAQSSDPLPAIILPHGGPASYDRFDFDWMAQYFANRGYMVLQPNFRGSEGFGQAFEDAGRGEWGGKMQDDISDGLNALVTSKLVDPERVCIVGSSYGGYAALAGAVFTPELYKCVIAIAPVSDLNRMLRDEKRDRGRHHWVLSYWENAMADGDARQSKLRSISPVRFAEDATAPVLLLHGDDDTVVPLSQSTIMKSALERAGKQVELVKLKGEDHWLSVADTRMQTLREMDRFISEHLPLE